MTKTFGKAFKAALYLIIWMLFVTFVTMAFTSCKKESVNKAPDFGKAYFRIQEVDNSGAVQHSNITVVTVKN
jgi:hypothetical protein